MLSADERDSFLLTHECEIKWKLWEEYILYEMNETIETNRTDEKQDFDYWKVSSFQNMVCICFVSINVEEFTHI